MKAKNDDEYFRSGALPPPGIEAMEKLTSQLLFHLRADVRRANQDKVSNNYCAMVGGRAGLYPKI
jgi:hypothetical protein